MTSETITAREAEDVRRALEDSKRAVVKAGDELAQLRAEVEYLCGVNSTFLRDHHADQDTIARLRDEVARLRKERGRLLMSDRPWSLRSVVEQVDMCGDDIAGRLGACEVCGQRPATTRCHSHGCDNACRSASEHDLATACCESCMGVDEVESTWKCRLCLDLDKADELEELAFFEKMRIREHWEAEARRACAQPTPGYTPAVRRVVAWVPQGYNAYELMEDPRDAYECAASDLIEACLASRGDCYWTWRDVVGEEHAMKVQARWAAILQAQDRKHGGGS